MPTAHMHDLAISAVAYDVCLVAELTGLLASRLQTPPIWAGNPSDRPEDGAAGLEEQASRIALVLPQRLWGHDRITAAEIEVLRQRALRTPTSVIVVTLDDEPLPQWMGRLCNRQLATAGVSGVAEFVLQTIVEAGGVMSQPASDSDDASLPGAQWPDPPPPYLRQARAHSALRRELDALSDALEAPIEAAVRRDGEPIFELQRLPNRIVARLDGVGVSFSWMPGRAGTVADGRLMVIEWADIAAGPRRDAFRTARPMREQVYCVEAMSSGDWYWRADGPNGRACSTAHLAGEWMDGATMTAALLRSH